MKVAVAFSCILLFIIGCSVREIKLPPSPLIQSKKLSVILPLYARVYQHPTVDSAILFPLRRGDIVQVVGNAIRPDGRWYQIQREDRSGWIIGKQIRFVHTAGQAEKLSQMLSNSRDP